MMGAYAPIGDTMKPISEMTEEELEAFFSDEDDLKIQMELEEEARKFDELNKEQESDMEDESFHFTEEELALAMALLEEELNNQPIAHEDDYEDCEIEEE